MLTFPARAHHQTRPENILDAEGELAVRARIDTLRQIMERHVQRGNETAAAPLRDTIADLNAQLEENNLPTAA